MSRVRLFAAAVAAVLGAVVLVAAPAQAATVTISGVVRDADGQPAPGVRVIVQVSGALTWPEATTSSTGAYSVSVTNGSVARLEIRVIDVHGQYLATSSLFALSSNRIESFALPAPSMVTTNVVEGADGTPAVNALVHISPRFAAATSSGLGLTFQNLPHCSTFELGSCTLRGFRGGHVAEIWANGSGRYSETFPGFPTPDPVATSTVVLAAAPRIAGVLRDADGTPVEGAEVTLVDAPRVYPTRTGRDGRWNIRSAPGGPYRLLVRGYATDVARSYEIESEGFDHSDARTVDLTVPAREQRSLHLSASNDGAVPGALITAFGTQSVAHASAGGLGFSIFLGRDGAGADQQCTTGSTSRCSLPVLARGSTPALRIKPPGGVMQEFPTTPFEPGVPEVYRTLRGYATAPSAGSSAGTVRAVVATGDIPDLRTAAADLPGGLDPVVGKIDYRVTLSPGSNETDLELMLVGTGADALFRERGDGDLELVGTAAETGGWTEKTLRLVDGSPEDADGAVNGSVSGTLIPATVERLDIRTSNLPSAAAGKAFAATLDGSGPGGPLVWSVAPGSSLPAGLTLRSDGLISGTAPAIGVYGFDVSLRDSRGWQRPVTRSLTLVVEKIAVLTSSMPDGHVGASYSSKLSFASGSFPTWRIHYGALPPGLKLAASTGVISGTPTSEGTFTFGVTVSANGNTSRQRVLTITVRPMEVVTASLSSAPVATSYSQKLLVAGGSGTRTWSVAGGALPPGLALSAAGTISGTPTSVGTWTVTVRVTDQSAPARTATRTLTLTVIPMEITTATLPDAKKGQLYQKTLTVIGGKTTRTWSVVGGSLPAGLTLSSGGKIAGYPKVIGTYTFTVRVQDASTPKNEATRTLTLRVT